jgi:hypothetical protein
LSFRPPTKHKYKKREREIHKEEAEREDPVVNGGCRWIMLLVKGRGWAGVFFVCRNDDAMTGRRA